MWGFDDGSFVAVGDAGSVLRCNNQAVTPLDPPTRESLQGIWASSPDDIYVAGLNGTLLHYDGDWHRLEMKKRDDFYNVWMSDEKQLFLTTDDGVWQQLPDKPWVKSVLNPERRYVGIWGYSDDEVYVGGGHWSVFRYDGESWTDMRIEYQWYQGKQIYFLPDISDMWGPEPGSVFFLTPSNWVFVRDGIMEDYKWLGVANPYGMWGLSADDFVFVSTAALPQAWHYVGGQRTLQAFPSPYRIYDVWGLSIDSYHCVGKYGSMADWDGTAWTMSSAGSFEDIHDMCAPPGGQTVAVGQTGRVLRRSGTTWAEESLGNQYELHGVWASNGKIVAVGRYTPDYLDWEQAILIDDGTGFQKLNPAGPAWVLNDVWGVDDNDIYAVGWGGEVVHFDGAGWSVAFTGSEVNTLNGVHATTSGEVFAVGRTNSGRGVIVHFDGTQWNQLVPGNTEELTSVWALSDTDVFAVGSLGRVLHFDGTSWAKVNVPTDQKLNAVWARASDEVYVAGWDATLLRYDGDTWTRLVPNTASTLNAIVADPSGNILVAGDNGSILRMD